MTDISTTRAWVMAARPKTLAAAAVPVVVGTAVAWREGSFAVGPALAALLGAGLIQIGTNLANDYFDHKKGADTDERLGPTRVVQSGLLPPERVFAAMVASFVAAALVGVYLVAVGGWPIVAIGVASIASGIAYTGGPYPIGYHGLGDPFVFVFFGVVAVTGTHFVQAASWSAAALIASIPVGALSTAILVVNNYRDIETDRRAGKRTLAVVLGRGWTRVEYVGLLAVAYGTPVAQWALGRADAWVLLTLATLPPGYRLVRQLARRRGRELNETLEGTARLLALFGLTYAAGLVI
jgi:1,4-dihydroxy-2-naphthoate octaprenyltransferase